NGDGLTVPNTDQDLVSGLVKGEFMLTPDQKLKVSGVFYRNDFTANSYDQTIDSDIWKAEYRYNPAYSPLINLSVNAYRSDFTMQYGNYFDPPTVGGSTGRNINTIGTGFNASNVSVLRLGGVKIR